MILETALADDRLTTERLALEPLAADHAAKLFPLMCDWEIVRMLAMPPWPLTRADVEAHAAKQGGQNPESIEFAILLDGAAIGVCGVKKPGSGHPPRIMPRLGYWIGRSCWRRGYASEAVSALVDFAFRAFASPVVGAGVFHDNPASRRVLEKLGFDEAGSYDQFCRARHEDVLTVDMHLSRARWESRRR